MECVLVFNEFMVRFCAHYTLSKYDMVKHTNVSLWNRFIGCWNFSFQTKIKMLITSIYIENKKWPAVLQIERFILNITKKNAMTSNLMNELSVFNSCLLHTKTHILLLGIQLKCAHELFFFFKNQNCYFFTFLSIRMFNSSTTK